MLDRFVFFTIFVAPNGSNTSAPLPSVESDIPAAHLRGKGCRAVQRTGESPQNQKRLQNKPNSMYRYDSRVVITLDAGGTNFVFGAMQANKFIVEPITMPSNAQDLDRCLSTMVEGFRAIIAKLETKPVAISFAFPGPATTATA